MAVFFRGFNLYKQVSSNKILMEQFHEIFCHENVSGVWLTHSCCFVKIGNDFLCRGAAQNDFNKLDFKILDIVDISVTDDKVFMLSNVGNIYKVNINDKNYNLNKITNLELEDNDKIIKIASGAKIVVAYSKEGFIFNNLNKLKIKLAEIKDIKCGREHCLLLTQKGDLYSFGRGSRGQLGHSTLDDLENPLQINALAGIKIKQISCGFWHSCAVSDIGDLYVWGWNANGQLGLKNSDNVAVSSTPCVVDFPDDINVTKVGCGSRHTVVLLENKSLFGAGWNTYKQLKDDVTEDLTNFTYLHDFSEFSESDIFCGPWSTCVVCR